MRNTKSNILVIGNYPALETTLYKEGVNVFHRATWYSGRNSLGENVYVIDYDVAVMKTLQSLVSDVFHVDGSNHVWWEDFSTGDISYYGTFKQSFNGPEDDDDAPWNYDGVRLVYSNQTTTVSYLLKDRLSGKTGIKVRTTERTKRETEDELEK